MNNHPIAPVHTRKTIPARSAINGFDGHPERINYKYERRERRSHCHYDEYTFTLSVARLLKPKTKLPCKPMYEQLKLWLLAVFLGAMLK